MFKFISCILVCIIFSVFAGFWLAKWEVQMKCDAFNQVSKDSRCTVTPGGDLQFQKIKLVRA